ncbi:ATP-binding protein [Planomicrobium sp. YIM 101495]|uniref:ATP-binding protein n=1 Tax=Planomicrobium sp. YIM 101495 TaxID=2665160 RepID=UPI0018A9A280
MVGNVIEIDGMKVLVEMNENSNALTYFFKGKTYKGVSIGEYIGIMRGPYKIIGKVEKEYLKDMTRNIEEQRYDLNRYVRQVSVNIIGSFYYDEFSFGIKAFPLIYNEVVLLENDEISKILGNNVNYNYLIELGETIQEGINVPIEWNNLFNTHIGIFGNTGSGKSNTLTKLFSELFKLETNTFDIFRKSSFLFLDFNGEYCEPNVFSENKRVIKLDTKKNISEISPDDKISLEPTAFWNIETLSILFSATEQTQKPFLQKALNNNLSETGEITLEILVEKIYWGFVNVFQANNNKDALRILKRVYKKIGLENAPWENLAWHSTNNTYYQPSTQLYINNSQDQVLSKADELRVLLNSDEVKDNIRSLSLIEKLSVIVHLQLIYGLKYNHVQYEHINPLISRIESRAKDLDKVLTVNSEVEKSPITVISLRNCNQDIKKIVPLLISKQKYQQHKDDIENNGAGTFHIIIDEAHNILSDKSKREQESWKDYRLEVFEEIVKEGRKFGFYMTIASQRPADISPTIVSQLHNFFIHRLVNDNDLRLIDNTISTLDKVSKNTIPNLGPGQCIVTGTSFNLPLIVQVKKLRKIYAPSSENVDLIKLWKINEENQ